MSADLSSIHLPPPPPKDYEDHTVWVGNIDIRVTEYMLLQLIRKYGTLLRFELPVHKFGPNRGQHRSFAFFSYETREEAEQAIASLQDKIMCNRRLSVGWARNQEECDSQRKPTDEKSNDKPAIQLSNEDKIQMIERKLRMMEHRVDVDNVNSDSRYGNASRTGAPESRNRSQLNLSSNRRTQPSQRRTQPYQRRTQPSQSRTLPSKLR